MDNRESAADTARTLSRGDTISLALFVIAGVGIAAWTAWNVAARIAELAGGGAVQVLVEFLDTTADARIGETTLPVELDRGAITVEGLGTMGTVSGILGQLAFGLTVIVVVACLITLSRNILRGRVFSKTNTRIVAIGGGVGLVGAAAAHFFDNMLSNAAMAQAVEGPFDTAVISIEPFTFVLAAFAIAVVGSVFVVGDRLQKDTEGLV
ncbi:DUF2975 domain-containing protein [Microbacterium esteraromaticum]|uniref:DUF2975 domain-containing protein n=1 Tax=Microbacterium esteraromaticum TaxID=57043 RepID=UPI00195E871C|nr:DUF2975 domain-containing protein [Microbacterium esteraromaticum]MBM7465574.1 hypothetical protein [Microbacterium esteraromaticum]